jgi:hypothetical protein
MQVDPESAQAFDPVGRIRDSVLLIGIPRVRRKSGNDGVFDLVPRKGMIPNRQQRSLNADRRWSFGYQQQIAAGTLYKLRQPVSQGSRIVTFRMNDLNARWVGFGCHGVLRCRNLSQGSDRNKVAENSVRRQMAATRQPAAPKGRHSLARDVSLGKTANQCESRRDGTRSRTHAVQRLVAQIVPGPSSERVELDLLHTSR